MSLSTLTPKFLLDENVRVELLRFLQTEGRDAIRAVKSATDKELAQQSLEQHRVLVTNDEDFSWCAESEIFAVVWLRIPQHDAQSLRNSFAKLLSECAQFNGKLILLKPGGWNEVSLGAYKNLAE